MKPMTTMLFGLLLTTLTSCSSEIQLAKYLETNSPLTIIINTTDIQTGLTSSDRKTLEPKLGQFNKFVDWCNNNSDGWQSTFVSYIAKVAVTQNDFRLLYNQDFVVIGFKDNNGKPQQYSKKIIKGELDFLTDNVVTKQHSNEIEQMTVGVFCGECGNHCATMYRYYLGGNANMLWVDNTDSYFKKGEDKMTFETQITDIKKYELVNDIIKHIPDSLLLTEKTRQCFGCPDCTDGCGIYLEIVQNKKAKKFAIDYHTSQLDSYIKEFAEYLIITIGKLNDEKH